ncbi:hypothetical protein TSUD_166090 [Trifolium subterraneum]|uniref:30S ribosomal protein S21, chloroplastic n=1 Tax=Trifolium subterraneum TaxID=3900 RepID=A0A2Z6MLA3_TRISU|nr:hypothetical protein TSUD_166090 [Trifolium subterraneum]
MALSTTSFSNFFSFLSPPSKSPPPQFPLLNHNNHRNKFIPLVLSRTETTSSTISVTPSSSQQQDDDFDFDSLSSSNSMSTYYNVQVAIEDDEPEERVVGMFRREVLGAGILQEFKRRRYFENTQEEKKRRVKDAAKQTQALRPMEGNFQRGPYNNYWQEDPKPEKEEDDDDNWDLPEEEADVIPF